MIKSEFEKALKTKGTKVKSLIQDVNELAKFVNLYQSETLEVTKDDINHN
jgi:hypothetical protein